MMAEAGQVFLDVAMKRFGDLHKEINYNTGNVENAFVASRSFMKRNARKLSLTYLHVSSDLDIQDFKSTRLPSTAPTRLTITNVVNG